MPYSITDFSHSKRGYVADGTGGNRYVSCRNVYTIALTGLTAAPVAGASQILVLHARRRYIHSINGGQPTNPGPVERHFPVAVAKAAAPATNTNLGVTIDGIANFVWKGYRGETDRA